jgi:nitrite reductase/ring-hydroxylating ferredoxin subunit/uncharacterized membrane protein
VDDGERAAWLSRLGGRARWVRLAAAGAPGEELALDVRTVGERLERAEIIDRVGTPLHRAVTTVLRRGPIKDVLHGVWLGHPLHPLLTDLPIGFWTSGVLLDLAGGRRSRAAADLFVGLGVATALPTAAAGLADWSELDPPVRRSGLVHAVANVTATALFALSLVARRRGRRQRGVLLGLAGGTVATVGGFLGGHLVYRRAAGVSRAAEAPDGSAWGQITLGRVAGRDAPNLAYLDDSPLALVLNGDEPAGLHARCSHLGGPLDEGDLVDGCLRCPWHGSLFRVVNGAVVRGPATAAQPAYEVRVEGGRTFARRRPPG